MGNRKCNFCESDIDPFLHGNRTYCDETCYLFAKKVRNKLKYCSYRAIIQEIQKAESILAEAYSIYGYKEFDATVLRHKAFNWTISTGRKEISNTSYISIGKYSYTLENHKTVKIIPNE